MENEHNQTLSLVRQMILEVMEEEEEGEIDISFETSFQTDLELESIEMIALADLLQTHYGEKLNFAQWLTQLSLQDLIDLTVGDLVMWIDHTLTA